MQQSRLKLLEVFLGLALGFPLWGCGNEIQVILDGSRGGTSSPEVHRLSPIIARTDESIQLFGTDLSATVKVQVNGQEVELDVQSPNLARFSLPEASSAYTVKVLTGDKSLAEFQILAPAPDQNLADIPAASVCKGTRFINSEGQSQEGELVCSESPSTEEHKFTEACTQDGQLGCVSNEAYPAVDREALLKQTEKFRKNLTFGGVSGDIKDCEASESACFLPTYSLVAQPLKAIDKREIRAEFLRSGIRVAGVDGSVLPSPLPCATDGAVDCVSSTHFPTLDPSAVNPSKFTSSLTIGGQAGTIPVCAANASACYLPAFAAGSQALKALNFDGLVAANIKNSVNIAGIIGTLPVLADDCGSDGETACLAIANFPAIEKSVAQAQQVKFHTSLSLGGIAGLMPSCSASISEACLSSTAFPSLDMAALLAGTAHLLSTATIKTISGSINACAASGSQCYIAPYVFGSQSLKAIDFESITANIVKLNVTLGGVLGSVIEAPALCGSDGQVACVTRADYPALDHDALDAGKSKFHSSLTLGGVIGELDDCNSDADTSCLAVADFPALKIADVDAAKIHGSFAAGGVTGSLADCSAVLSESCRSTAAFPSVDRDAIDAAKALMRPGLTVEGITGTMVNCAALDSNCYLPSFADPAQPLKAINVLGISSAKIRDGVTIAGITGNVVEKPDNCQTDGETACVTVTDFPALATAGVVASRIHDTLIAGAIAGTMPDCLASGDVNCLTSASFPPVNAATLATRAAGIHDSLSFASVSGTLDTCAVLGSNCYLPPYSAGVDTLKAIHFTSIAAANIKDGTTLAGIPGTLIEAPAVCSADGELDCVADANFPAVNSNTATTQAGKFHSSLSAGLVIGSMSNCNADGVAGCLSVANFPSTIAASINAAKGGIHDSLSFGGVDGTLANCAALGSACYVPAYTLTTQPLKAIDANSITPGVIKKNSIIAGVTGDYPSVTYPMPVTDGLSDITTANFNASLADSDSFGWFSTEGVRLTHAGDDDLVPGNIRKNTEIFGVTGNYTVPAAWDVRVGVAYDVATSGKLKVNCRNLFDPASLNVGIPRMATANAGTDLFEMPLHPFTENMLVRIAYGVDIGGNMSGGGTNDLQTYYIRYNDANHVGLSLTSGGALLDIDEDVTFMSIYRWGADAGAASTIDFKNAGGVPAVQNLWGSDEPYCIGLDTVDDSRPWKDVTPGTCDSPAKDCIYKDKITNIQWSRKQAYTHYLDALRVCDALDYGGYQDWRLPSMFELQAASAHGLFANANANWMPLSEMQAGFRIFYSSTKVVGDVYRVWFVELQNGYTHIQNLADVGSVICARD